MNNVSYCNKKDFSVGQYDLIGDIEPDDLVHLLYLEETLEVNNLNKLEINISSAGGCSDTAFGIYECLKRMSGKGVKIIGNLYGEVASAATFPVMLMDEVHVGVGASFLIHSAQIEGIESSIALPTLLNYLEKMSVTNKQAFHIIYKDFLSPEEIDEVLKGTDIVLTHDELKERLASVNKLRVTADELVKDIYEFNGVAGLLDQGYSPYREACYQIEEALEGFDLTTISKYSDIRTLVPETLSAKVLSRQLLLPVKDAEIAEVEAVDKALDAIVFAFGALFKVGLTIDEALLALKVVTTANLQKIKNPVKDSEGKLVKPEGFIEPQEQIEIILDKVRKRKSEV